MFWGNAAAADSSRSIAVFDTANGYQAVWHLGEAGAGNTNDATVNNFTGTASGATKPAETVGIIGRGKSFDGTASSFVVAGSATGKLDFPQGGPYTISAWVNTNVIDGFYHDILTKGDHQYSMALTPTTSNWQVSEFENATGWLSSRSVAAAGAWRYMVGIRNGNTISLYLDGAKVADSNFAYPSALARVTTFNAVIGGNLDTAGYGTGGNGNHLFNGMIDELCLANTARSADWIKLTYENERPGGTMSTFLLAPRSLTYSTNPASYVAGTAIAANSPASTGGAVASYSVAPALPAGLTFNTATGVITGTPTTPTAQANYTVTATNAGGSTSVSLSITVTLAPPANLTYSSNPATYVTGTAITANSPDVNRRCGRLVFRWHRRCRRAWRSIPQPG